MNSITNHIFEIKDGNHTYKINNLEFNSTEERLYGNIKLIGANKQSEFYIDFTKSQYEVPHHLENYKEDYDENIHDVIMMFYSKHIKIKESIKVKNGNFIITKEILFK